MSRQTEKPVDTKKVRQQARKIIGQAGLEQLAEHDAALVHHTSEIERLISWRDDHLVKATKHAETTDQQLLDVGVLAATAKAEVAALTAARLAKGLRGALLRWLLGTA